MAFKDGRLNPQDESRLGCHGGINLFVKLYPNMMEASLVRKCMVTIGNMLQASTSLGLAQVGKWENTWLS